MKKSVRKEERKAEGGEEMRGVKGESIGRVQLILRLWRV